MKIDLNKIVSSIILISGFGVFFLNIANHYAFASMSILATILIWIIWNKSLNTLNLNAFFTLILISGIIISATLLITFGIEPVGTRKGTLIHFHSDGIAIALGVLFFTLIPYIVFNLKFKLPKPFNITFVSSKKSQSYSSKKSPQDKYVVGDANWEIASDDDVKSGNYNID